MIYFAQVQRIPYLIKMGFTQEENLSSRMSGLKSESGSEIQLLATIPGNQSEEIDLHFRFEEERAKGEWFLPSERLIEFIAKNADPNKVTLIKHSKKPIQNIKNTFLELKNLRYGNRNLQKENSVLYEESKRLLSENIKLEAELRKYKPETKNNI